MILQKMAFTVLVRPSQCGYSFAGGGDGGTGGSGVVESEAGGTSRVPS